MYNITYRPYQRRDFKTLSAIINTTWNHEASYSAPAAVRLSNAYLRLCLTEQTFTQVAQSDGKPIGIIMGNDLRSHRCPLALRLQAQWAAIVLSLTAEGRRAWHFFEEIDCIYKKLLLGQSQKFQGELSFLAIHPDYRGFGIGRELYNRFYQYMERRYIQHFYVFTDTTCNYSFYERQNMLRCGTEKVTLKVNNRRKPFLFFIYENAGH